MSEPEWMKSIPNSWPCNWFYFFFWFNLTAFVLFFIAIAFLFMSTNGSIFKGAIGMRLLTTMFALVAAIVNAMFFYIICNRSLQPSS